MQIMATSFGTTSAGIQRKLVNLTRENFDVKRRGKPVADVVPIADQRHAQPESGERSKETDHNSLAKKDPDDLPDWSRPAPS